MNTSGIRLGSLRLMRYLRLLHLLRLMGRSRLFWLALVFVALALALPAYLSAYVLGLLTMAYYFGVFSMSWDLLFGFAGEVNFGPTFLLGLGAYSAGILNASFGLAIPWCILAGSLAAVLGGVALALPALRLSGPYFGLTTLVAVLLLQNVIIVSAAVTGGEIGLTVPDVIATSAASNYYIALGVMVFCGLFLFLWSRSPLGLILQAIGQDPIEAATLGFNVTKHKLAAFVVSAFFTGLAGAFLVFYLGTASVGTMIEVAVGVQIIISAVLGGRRTIVGSVLGAVFMIAATEALRPLGTLSTFVASLAALAIIMLTPNGLLGLLLRRREGE
jgi:branched-chain amino acid transport system permease protein